MSDAFVAEVRIFSFDFPPKGWAFCDGQQLNAKQNSALYSLLGTQYGGNGNPNFSLPNLQGRAVVHPNAVGDIGKTGGAETVTLAENQLGSHTHAVMVNVNPANLAAPGAKRSFARSAPGSAYSASTQGLTKFAQGAVGITGGGGPHNNMQPFLTLRFCIALQGVFPPRP